MLSPTQWRCIGVVNAVALPAHGERVARGDGARPVEAMSVTMCPVRCQCARYLELYAGDRSTPVRVRCERQSGFVPAVGDGQGGGRP